MKRRSGRYDTNSYDTFTDGDSDSYQCCITFSLRALPFVIFHGNRKMPKWLERIEKSLPAMIMSILIIYCLKDIGDNMFGVGIPRLLAVVITGGSYKLWHNTFVSMAAGTLSYMGLLYLFSHVLTMA